LHFSKLTAATFAFGSLLIGIANAQTVLRSADTHPDGYPTVEAVKYMGDLIKQRTDGRYSVEVYHSAQLGEEKDTKTAAHRTVRVLHPLAIDVPEPASEDW